MKLKYLSAREIKEDPNLDLTLFYDVVDVVREMKKKDEEIAELKKELKAMKKFASQLQRDYER